MDINEGPVDNNDMNIDIDEHPCQPSPQLNNACQPSPQPNNAEFIGPGDHLYQNYHADLDGRPCDADGVFLPPGAPPPPPKNVVTDDWTPFHNHSEFETAEFLYTRNQMAAGQIDHLLDLWASTLAKHTDKPLFGDHRDLYNVIDSSPFRDVTWQNFTVAYDGERLTDDIKPWMDNKYKVWFRDPCEVVHNMLANLTYSSEIDYRPYQEYSTEGDKWQWKDFMSDDWVWDQADEIVKDPSTLGSMFVPVILGSNKTTVSVGTGNNEYYPLYASIGNIHNSVCQAHHNGVVVIRFLAMPKTTNEHAKEPVFQQFHQQLFHLLLSKILNSLKPGMTTPEVMQFGDGHYWWVIYGLGPYIADYKEQVLCVANHDNLNEHTLCRLRDHTEALIEEAPNLDGDLWDDFGIVKQLVPFTNDFPRADIYQMISLDILHQLIKGTFKDHLVVWVEKYLRHMHHKRKAEKIMDDIDHRIAVTSFSGLWRFPQGYGFKQWTGDDSKALMKVYLPAIKGHVPTEVVRAFRALLDFAYLVCRDIITEDSLLEIKDTLARFHHYCEIFKMTGVISTFSWPCQHSLVHYIQNIQLFAALNGLCSSIMENKHIKAILLTNQQLDKLSAAGQKCTQTVPALADKLDIPCLPDLLGQFLFQQLHPNDPHDLSDVPLTECPRYLGKISVFNSASSCFYTPSNLSGIGGMHVEYIQSCPSWRNEHSHHDCLFINTDSSLPGMQGLEYQGEVYPCAVICWFNKVSDTADEDTGMWIVHPECSANNSPEHAIIHIDAIYRAAHLIPVYGM
ncbi:hypothetical protein EDB19DRAFT_1896127 [Suillus lakei]|nr:hypothetical protein EDB19DRAFT_1896127 [Suillus lakei]